MNRSKELHEPEIVDKQEIFGGNLFVKTSEILSNHSAEVISKVTGILLESTEDDIFRLLREECFLKSRIESILIHLSNVNEVCSTNVHDVDTTEADLLFEMVQSIDKENSCKLTGMILELGTEFVKKLINDKDALEIAVKKAKIAIDTQEVDAVGEKLFQEVYTVYPDLADKITGMLMELEMSKIQKLLEDKHLLKQYIDKANVALNEAKSCYSNT